MKVFIGITDNDNVFKLKPIIEISQKANENEITVDDIVYMLEEECGYSFLASEFLICVATNKFYKPLGIYLVSKGDANSCDFLTTEMARFILTIAAEKFFTVHNHPTIGKAEPSIEDKANCLLLDNIGNILDIDHIDDCVIARDEYCWYNCNGIDRTESWEGLE